MVLIAGFFVAWEAGKILAGLRLTPAVPLRGAAFGFLVVLAMGGVSEELSIIHSHVAENGVNFL
jgi:hypothetical protein